MATSDRSANMKDAATGKNGATDSDADLQALRDDVARLAQQVASLLVATAEGNAATKT